MRIAILTLPLHINYGGILQAYALQTVLKRMGHEVCLIEEKQRTARLPLWKAPLSYGKRILKNIMGCSVPIFYEQKINRETLMIRQNTDLFINKYITRRIVANFSDISETDFDAIVVGSDQIWRPKYFPQVANAYLDFTEGWNVKRIAYAVSFGTNEWEYSREQTEHCKELVKQFDAVSVRESSGIDMCREHFGIEIQHVLDPTMLLKKEDYIYLFKNTDIPKSNGTLLYYMLDDSPEKRVVVNKLADENGFKIFRVNAEDDISLPIEKKIAPPIEQWLRGFYDAEFVVTDSFHACVFSIIFNKPFIAFGNVIRGMSRFSSLLSMFGLEDRLRIEMSDYIVNGGIDWNRVNSLLNKKRESSIKFLVNSLNR